MVPVFFVVVVVHSPTSVTPASVNVIATITSSLERSEVPVNGVSGVFSITAAGTEAQMDRFLTEAGPTVFDAFQICEQG